MALTPSPSPETQRHRSRGDTTDAEAKDTHLTMAHPGGPR